MSQFKLPLSIEVIESIVAEIQIRTFTSTVFVHRENFALLILPTDTYVGAGNGERAYGADEIVKIVQGLNPRLADEIQKTCKDKKIENLYLIFRESFDRMPGRMRHVLVTDLCNDIFYPDNQKKQEIDEQDIWTIDTFKARDDAFRLIQLMLILTKDNKNPDAARMRSKMTALSAALSK